MGADGGLVFCKLKDPSKFNRLQELLAPFWGYLCYSEGYNGSNWKKQVELEKEHPHHVWTTYGTNQEIQGLESLRELVNQILEPGFESRTDFTWKECIEDVITAPWLKYNDSVIYKCISFHFEDFFYNEESYMKNSEIIDMKITVWAKEIKDILDFDKLHRVETWT